MKKTILTLLLCMITSANTSYSMYHCYSTTSLKQIEYETCLYLMEQKRQEMELERQKKYPLHVAAEDGDMEKIVALLNGDRTLVHLKDDSGETALHKAARYGYLRTTRLLLIGGAQQTLNNNKEGPFELAQKNGHDLVAKLLTNHWYHNLFV